MTRVDTATVAQARASLVRRRAEEACHIVCETCMKTGRWKPGDRVLCGASGDGPWCRTRRKHPKCPACKLELPRHTRSQHPLRWFLSPWWVPGAYN